jgi:hypothetical protein
MTDADVDGCLRGDTKIKLMDGTYKTMQELSILYPSIDDKFYVYSTDENGKIVPGIAHSVRITKKTKKIYRIILDNNTFIETTDNHPFRLTNGEYKRADELTPGESLMTMYYRKNDFMSYNKNREYIYNKESKSWDATHRYISEMIYGDIKDKDVHHINENPYDNNPDNLVPLTKKEHRTIHGKNSHLTNIFNGSEYQKDILLKNWSNGVYANNGQNLIEFNKSFKHSSELKERNMIMWQKEEYVEHIKQKQKEYLLNGGYEILSNNTKKQWENEDLAYKMQMTRIVNVIKVCLEKESAFNEEIYNRLKPKNGVPKYSTFMKKYNFSTDIEVVEFVKNYNHLIKAIEIIDVDDEDVYDMSVDKYHNFGVVSGDNSLVFVHNSHITTLLLTFFYRYLIKIIENGNLYLAQPPLYKYKKGKKEIYIKNDKELYKFLLNESGIKKDEQEKLIEYKNLFEYCQNKIAPKIVIEFVLNNDLNDENIFEKSLEWFGTKYNIMNKTNNKISLTLYLQTDSGLEVVTIEKDLYKNLKIERLKKRDIELKKIYTNPYDDLHNMIEESKKGAYIQRYKGLGEMNPEQLWETTMDPKNRTLIQVTIEDAEAAEKSVVLLMGAQVEDRKNFITENAKNVKNLDI